MTIPFRPVARSASGSTSGEKADMARRTRRSRRSGVVLRGNIRNPYLPPRQPSLLTAVRDATVKESLSSPFALPPRRGRRVAAAARRSRWPPRCDLGQGPLELRLGTVKVTVTKTSG